MAEIASVEAAAANPSAVCAQTPARKPDGLGLKLWTTFVLSLVAMLAAIDRQTFSVLLVPIQKQLHASDAAMGGLTGTAFAVVYAIVALPVARLADRTNRRNLLAISVAIWSTATAACGLTSNYLQLLIARIAIGSAESAQSPATMSLIGDIYSANRRGTAISFIVVGSALGFAGGSALAGFLNDRYNWHVAQMAVGAPGLLLALALFLTVREPMRGAQDGAVAPGENLAQCLGRLARIKTIYPFATGIVFLNVCFSGWLAWTPAFFIRVHHLSPTRMGAIFGAIIACATIATLVGGPLSDALAKRGARWRLYYCGVALIFSIPILAASTLVTSLDASIACMVAYTLVSGGLSAVTTATYLSFAPPAMRGLVTAVMNLSAGVLGAGAAPTIFGAVNDALKHSYGDQSLRYTMLIAPAALAIACVMFLLASRTIDADVAAVAPTPNR